MNFAFHLISTTGRSSQHVYRALSENEDELLKPAIRWGAFHGLFGLSSSELILVTTGDLKGIHSRLANTDEVERVRTLALEPTARPTDEEPRTREGLYVFRFFDVMNKDVEQIAQLSKDAWVHFENTDRYQAIPQALFCEANRLRERGKMLLVTWYDGLNSWQESRRPPPEAAENFRQRGDLTLGTRAFATRLIVPTSE